MFLTVGDLSFKGFVFNFFVLVDVEPDMFQAIVPVIDDIWSLYAGDGGFARLLS